MACQVLRCASARTSAPARPGTPSAAVPAAFALCGRHRAAIDRGAPWTVHTPTSLLVGADALYELPRVVKRLRAAVADTVQLVDGRRRPLVQLDLTIGLEGTDDHDRDLQLVLPAHAARALGEALPQLADEAERGR
jgi:hypothetical protein